MSFLHRVLASRISTDQVMTPRTRPAVLGDDMPQLDTSERSPSHVARHPRVKGRPAEVRDATSLKA